VKGRPGISQIFQVDVQSGEATAVILSDGVRPQWLPDGKKIVYSNSSGVTVERDMASGTERDVYVGTSSNLSHDGRYVVSKREDPSTKTASLLLVPVAGGQPRELLRLTQPEMFAPADDMWTPDDSAVIVMKDTGSRWELWLVPVAGGRPRKLDIDPNIWLDGALGKGDQGVSLSPDGHSIAFQIGKTVTEVWALENFLPKATAKR
jgi:Tol biopolymer transport system component